MALTNPSRAWSKTTKAFCSGSIAST